MGDKTTIKRLSIPRRVDLIFAFFRDARKTILRLDPEAMRHNAQLRKEVQRQIENAIRDALQARIWPEFEFSNEELCPACGVPTVQHGSIKVGQWNVTICAGVSGQSLFVIGPDAAMAIVGQLKEKEAATKPGCRCDRTEDGFRHDVYCPVHDGPQSASEESL